MHFNAFSHSRLTAVTHPRFKACLQWKDTLRLRETMPRREKSRNKQVRSNLLHQFWFLTYKRSVKRSVNTLGSMYAINAEYKYSHGWLSEKKHAYQKPFMLISKPPSPRLYRFNIKLLLFLIYLKVFKVRAKKLNYFWLTHFYCFFSPLNIPDLRILVLSLLNTWTLHIEMGHWLFGSVCLRGKWIFTKIKRLQVWPPSTVDTGGDKLDQMTTMAVYFWLHDTPSEWMLNYKRLLFVQRIPVMMFAVIDCHAAQIEQKCFSCCLHVCIILVPKWDVWGNLQVNIRGKLRNKDKKKGCWWDLRTMTVVSSLTETGQINIAHLHFVCPHTHTYTKLYHTFKHTILNSTTLFSHCHRHAHITGIGLYSCDTGVCVFPKTLMLCFLSAKSKVFRELGVSLKIHTSLRCPSSPFFSPPPSRPAG